MSYAQDVHGNACSLHVIYTIKKLKMSTNYSETLQYELS
jgi:hypothetical protein